MNINNTQTALLTGKIILFLGISGSGKTTLGKKLYTFLKLEKNFPVEFIDGDLVRDFLNIQTGYTPKERDLVTRYIAYATHLLAKNGTNVIVSNIAASLETRDFLKQRWGDYIQIFLDADINDCIKNDPKNVYKNNMSLKKPLLYGIDLEYQKPLTANIVLKPFQESIEDSFKKIKAYLEHIKFI